MAEALARSTELFQAHDFEDMDVEAMRLDALLETGEFAIRAVSDPHAVEAEWRQLQDHAFGTLFTSYEWLSSWYDRVGRGRGIEALIVVGELEGKPAFLLPLSYRRRAGGLATVGRFLGDFHGNQNSGLWRRDILAGIHAKSLHKALIRVGAENGVDLFDLKYVPATLDARIHPLVDNKAVESLNAVHAFPLQPDFDTLYKARRSSSARKKLRTKERKLAEAGPLTFRRADDLETALAFLDTLIAQRGVRQASQGIPNVFDVPDMRAFLREQLKRSLEAGDDRFMIYALECGSEVRATYLCGMQYDRFHAYTNSIDEDAAACSPGDLLLNHVIADACALGATCFDFGLGAERYKTAWADKEVLLDVDVPVTLRGRIMLAAIRQVRSAKRRIRNTPALWQRVRQLRKLVG
ncbi:GNAT family N-acetyltransferase [Stappia sp. ICDLI1TA098]|jgi:CelD/BcsL family acetyltransferase involved in cellulose biosynthesis